MGAQREGVISEGLSSPFDAPHPQLSPLLQAKEKWAGFFPNFNR